MASLNSNYTHYARVPLPNTTLTVNIRTVYTHQFRLRVWCGVTLIRLAAWCLGCNIAFEGTDEAAQ